MKLLNLGLICAVALPLQVAFAAPAAKTALDNMAAPITHPTVFEDPRSTTELRPIYIYHKIGDDFVTGGGAATVYALQARYAVDDRLSIIATKDGYVDLNTDQVLNDENGWADVAAGAKYAVYLDPQAGQIVSLGLRYEIPLGTEDIFQGQGKGALNPFISAATTLGPINVMAGTGFRLALDNEDSSFYDFNLHFDTKMEWFHPIVEFSVTSVTAAGDRLPIADEGEDFFNFGSSKSNGETLVSGAVGARFDLADNLVFGAAYQFPLSDGEGSNILDYRITTDLIVKF